MEGNEKIFGKMIMLYNAATGHDAKVKRDLKRNAAKLRAYLKALRDFLDKTNAKYDPT